MVTNTDYALLAAWANSPMPGDLEGGGQPWQNFISLEIPISSAPTGWKVQTINLARINTELRKQADPDQRDITAPDLSGMAAFVLREEMKP